MNKRLAPGLALGTVLGLALYASTQGFVNARIIAWAAGQDTPADAKRAIEVLKGRLDTAFASSALHEAIGARYATLSGDRNQPALHRAIHYRLAAKEYTEAATARPGWPYAYANAVRYAFAGKIKTDLLEPPMKRALYLGPHEPTVLAVTTETGLGRWGAWSPQIQAAIIAASNTYAHDEPTKWRRIVQTRKARSLACAHLHDIPESLSRYCPRTALP